jgi:UDP-glucose 4-epimerase
MEKVLITGIAGGQGRLLARRLRENYEVCGVDRVGWEGAPRGVKVHVVDVRKKKFEDVIRTEMPTAVVHMGFVRHFRTTESERYDTNVRGTKQLLDHCINHGVQKVVVLSSSYVYGAFPENPYFLDEDAPLSASRSYPEIRDIVEVDTLASTYLWRYPHLHTCVLRPVNVLGTYVHSMIGEYLKQTRIPTVMGFDPMMQFIHEEDLSEAIALALEHGLQGVFNVAGPGQVPLHTAIHETGGTALPVPEPILRAVFDRAFRWGFQAIPPAALDYLKYPVTISGDRFVETTKFRCLFELEEIFQSVVR